MVKISLHDILTYIDVGLRPLKEGEAVLNAEHVIMCGINAEKSEEIVALCQQTSYLKGPPHSLKLLITGLPHTWECKCSCKAGESRKCKHIVACLLFANRNQLDLLSRTDLEQAWGKRKTRLNEETVRPVSSYCHVKQIISLPQQSFNEFEQNSILQDLIAAVPHSEAALHQRRKRSTRVLVSISHDKQELKQSIKQKFMISTNRVTFLEVLLSFSEEDYFNRLVKISIEGAIQLAEDTIGQQNKLWKSARLCRITASRCYELYTYGNRCSNTNWSKKLTNYIKGFSGNKYTQYGKKFEPAARICYMKQFGKIHDSGLIVNPAFPWLACSPDGLKLLEGHIYKIVEFKCPVVGAHKGITDLILDLPYIEYNPLLLFPYVLKKKHIYYGQIQLSMAILNIELSDFVIYSSVDDNVIVIEVERDEEFIISLLQKLHYVYFKHYLPILCDSSEI